MSTVRSIIIFNGGAVGDFLRVACLQQLNNFDRYRFDVNGCTIYPLAYNYLKELCKEEQRTNQHQSVDISRCFEIENAHNYCPWFQQLTSNLFYIHHNDNDTLPIVEAFIRKRPEIDFDLWVKTMSSHIPSELLDKINPENYRDVLSIFWKKNIRCWQANSLLTPIPFRDLFEISTLTNWVERLCGQPLSNPDQLASMHQAWLDKNSTLLTSLT